MSKYTLPTSEFGKLNLGEELKESRPVMPKTTRSGVQKQKATSSSRVPTKTAAGPSKTTSKSLASRTTRTASTQKRRPASGKARLEPEEEDDEEEDEDSDDSDDDDGDDDDDNDNNQSNAETDDARRRRTITELLSILTDTFMTPQEFDLPNASTPPIMRTNRTTLLRAQRDQLVPRLLTQQDVDNYAGPFTQAVRLSELTTNLHSRFEKIKGDLFLNAAQPDSGRDVIQTRDDIYRLQGAIMGFVAGYGQALLAGGQLIRVTTTSVQLMLFIVTYNWDLYDQSQRQAYAGHIYGSNLYQTWLHGNHANRLLQLLYTLRVPAEQSQATEISAISQTLRHRGDLGWQMWHQRFPNW